MRAPWLDKEWPTHRNSVTGEGADSQPMTVLDKLLRVKPGVRHIVGEVGGIPGKHGVGVPAARCLTALLLPHRPAGRRRARDCGRGGAGGADERSAAARLCGPPPSLLLNHRTE